jgi:hypothetical protein
MVQSQLPGLKRLYYFERNIASTLHAFENQGTEPAEFISFNSPGGFETKMQKIALADR